MSDGDSSSSPSRRRPSYGLPAPTDGQVTPGAQGDPAGQAPGAPVSGSAYGSPSSGSSSYGSPATGEGPTGGPSGAGPSDPYAAPAPVGGAPAPRRRRRGVVPLVIGLVLLVIIGPVAVIGGLVWGFSSVMGQAASGPTAIQGSTGTVEMSANEMLILYVPTADSGATCTVEGSSAGDVTTVGTSGTVTAPDGTEYEQTLGAVATADTTATITCEGTQAPAYMGPLDVFGIALPLVLGPIIGILAGLVGLVLTIVGIVLLVRSRQS